MEAANSEEGGRRVKRVGVLMEGLAKTLEAYPDKYQLRLGAGELCVGGGNGKEGGRGGAGARKASVRPGGRGGRRRASLFFVSFFGAGGGACRPPPKKSTHKTPTRAPAQPHSSPTHTHTKKPIPNKPTKKA
jgi:hypothetical protein